MVPGTADVRSKVTEAEAKGEGREEALVFLLLPSWLWELLGVFQESASMIEISLNKISTCVLFKGFLLLVDLLSS